MVDHIIILAAGYGRRMRSKKSKAAQVFAGKPMINWAYDLAKSCQPKFIHVVHNKDNQKELVRLVPFPDIMWIKQEKICGTGDALRSAIEHIYEGQVLVLFVDMPLIETSQLNALLHCDGDIKLLTAMSQNPKGYGRIIRDHNEVVQSIVEELDLSPDQHAIQEVFTGILSAPVALLKKLLAKLDNNNQQKEFLLTDIVKYAKEEKQAVNAVKLDHDYGISGVNTIRQLVELEKQYYLQRAYQFLDSGVRIADPERFVCTGDIEIGHDTVIEPNVTLVGPCQIGHGCYVGQNSRLDNVQLGDYASVHPYSFLKQTYLAANASVGPFGYCREGTVLADHAEVGAFVETKQAYIGHNSKAKHLSYLGDIDIGRHVNIGAGTIVCNYDGQKKHKTIIGNHVFVGSDSQLIAPVNLKDYTFVAAGTCVTEDVPENTLAIGRSRQTNRKKPTHFSKSHTEIENL
ncbi:MAG: UDP-N-acetylglucosamine diphosphorylase/glucosamine-1-phosphate N-acetyltransferase [Legionellales bacterium]|nr:UDP-N-acetylglucosamine diphosphorylase/glucosamine-1-phosphate N-acetyltransferase [Legionellales bacterium]|tara:strand:- start:839 stop:2215 length:1377 start_codon:yes stop_codon:yes gene_type:complete